MAKRSRVPGIKAGKGGWAHFRQVADSKRWKLVEGERVVAALPVPDTEHEPRSDAGILHVRCSRCQGRLRMGSYVLPVGVDVYCERCSGR